jgi:hypothetical protein
MYNVHCKYTLYCMCLSCKTGNVCKYAFALYYTVQNVNVKAGVFSSSKENKLTMIKF